MENMTVGRTIKKKFVLTLFGGLLFFGIVFGALGFTGTVFAVPLGGMGDFYVTFDELEGDGFGLNPQIGETGEEDEAPLVRNTMEQATIDNLHIYKDLKMPTGGWIRVNVKADEPTEIEGLIQDARFIDADLDFDDMAIEQTDTSDMSEEEAFQKNWTQDADDVKITDAKIVTDYLFQDMVALKGAEIFIETIDEPEYTEGVNSDDDKSNTSTGSSTNDGDGGGGGGILPKTASNLWLSFIIGPALMLIGGVIFLVGKRKRFMNN